VVARAVDNEGGGRGDLELWGVALVSCGARVPILAMAASGTSGGGYVSGSVIGVILVAEAGAASCMGAVGICTRGCGEEAAVGGRVASLGGMCDSCVVWAMERCGEGSAACSEGAGIGIILGTEAPPDGGGRALA
jgi:hypothetical protein